MRPLLLLLPLALLAEQKPVTLEAVQNYRPEGAPRIVWAPQGRTFLYSETGKLYRYDAAARKAEVLVELATLEAAAQAPPTPKRFDWQNRRVTESPVQWMPDGRRILISAKGDLFLLDPESKQWQQVTATPVHERDPKPSPDGTRIAYRIDHDLYVHDLKSKKVTRLTTDGSAELLNGELDWVYPEELNLATAFWWSPDGAQLAYLQFDTSKLAVHPQTDLAGVKAFVEPQKYPKAGTPNSDVRLGVVAASGGATRWMDLGDTRQHLLARVHWVPPAGSQASGTLFVQRLNRVQNRLDLLAVDARLGSARTVFSESDPAWINIADDLHFLPSRQQFLWSSERSGFRHLYLYDYSGQERKRLTSGEWEVKGVTSVDEKAGRVYFLSSERSPIEQHLGVVELAGGAPRLLTSASGTHNVQMSPTADYYLDSYSSLKSPAQTAVHRGDGTEWAVFRAAKPVEHNLLPVEIVKVRAADGAELIARLIKPAGFDPAKRYPAIVMVYGGPHAQTVRDAFAGPNWEQAMAYQGFVVWGLDNRGSAGRGHAWESKLYRRFGQQELEDQRKGIEHLVGLGFVDPARIGMYGWSYGGFMTLYTLLNAPDLVAAGIAGAPVTDRRNCDTIYTERYLGLPQENASGYRDSSPVNYAKNLKGQLLLVHNFGDDNVFFQHTFQMADALQRAGKPFQMMIYPQKSHGVGGAARSHLNQMMTDFFEKALRR